MFAFDFLDGSFAPTVRLSGYRTASVVRTAGCDRAKEGRKPSTLKGFLRALGGRRHTDF